MNITQYFKLAVKSLRTSKMRAFQIGRAHV